MGGGDNLGGVDIEVGRDNLGGGEELVGEDI